MITSYIVLRSSNEDRNVFTAIDTVSATSAAAAIKAAFAGDNGAIPAETQFYVAVPARSWKPVAVTVEQKTTVKLG